MGLAGVPQVDVHVDKPRQHQLAGSVDHLGPLWEVGDEIFADFYDFVPVGEDVVESVDAVFRADDPPAFD